MAREGVSEILGRIDPPDPLECSTTRGLRVEAPRFINQCICQTGARIEVNVNINAPGERLLTRMWVTLTEKGIGSLLRPWQLRREGRAQIELRAQEVLALAEANRDADEIRAGRMRYLTDGTVVALPVGPADAVRLAEGVTGCDLSVSLKASRAATADAIRREVNTGNAILQAEAVLQDDPGDPSPREVDTDWLFRWRDGAAGVSSDELQSLWGKVLAGEVKSPGSYSLRTLDFLRNLSREEAEQIAKLSPFVIADFIFAGDQALLDGQGITFHFLHRLQQLGVIAGVETVGLHTTLNSTTNGRFTKALRSHGRVLVVDGEDATKPPAVPAYATTTVGKEIISLGRFEPHEPYLRSLGLTIQKQGFTVKIASVLRFDATTVTWTNGETLE